MKQKFISVLLLAAFCKISYAQDLKLSIDNGIGFFTFSTSKSNSYLQKAEDIDFTKLVSGIKVKYGLKNLKISLRLSQLGQTMEWDSVNVFPYSNDGVWSSINIDYKRIQFFVGLGYELKLNSFFIEPEFALMFSKSTKFDAIEKINYNTFTPIGPATYKINFEEYGARFSVEFGYYFNERFSIGIRPGYLYGELEANIV